mgnify:CR=1 FL=1
MEAGGRGWCLHKIVFGINLFTCASPVNGFNVNLWGTDNYEDTKNSDVIIITAGVPRKPGMTRDDLLGINLKIIKQVAEGIKKSSPNAFV